MKSISERFWEKVDKTPGHGPDGDCWIWTGSIFDRGKGRENSYGRFVYKGRKVLAHRVARFLTSGEVPSSVCVLHRCDNPPCVNPAHLFDGDYLLNNQDRNRKGRTAHGEKHWKAKLTDEQVAEIRRLYRFKSTSFGSNALARQFGVSPTHIHWIVSGKSRVYPPCLDR